MFIARKYLFLPVGTYGLDRAELGSAQPMGTCPVVGRYGQAGLTAALWFPKSCSTAALCAFLVEFLLSQEEPGWAMGKGEPGWAWRAATGGLWLLVMQGRQTEHDGCSRLTREWEMCYYASEPKESHSERTIDSLWSISSWGILVFRELSDLSECWCRQMTPGGVMLICEYGCSLLGDSLLDQEKRTEFLKGPRRIEIHR